MIDPKILEQIQQTPIAERLHIIELILESLKRDMPIQAYSNAAAYKPFVVRQFSLGQEARFDRDELYAEKVI